MTERMTGLGSNLMEWLGLTCLQLEMKRSSEYSSRLRRLVKRARKRFNIDQNKTRQLQDILSSAHDMLQFKSIEAKNGYKSIK